MNLNKLNDNSDSTESVQLTTKATDCETDSVDLSFWELPFELHEIDFCC